MGRCFTTQICIAQIQFHCYMRLSSRSLNVLFAQMNCIRTKLTSSPVMPFNAVRITVTGKVWKHNFDNLCHTNLAVIYIVYTANLVYLNIANFQATSIVSIGSQLSARNMYIMFMHIYIYNVILSILEFDLVCLQRLFFSVAVCGV